MKDLAIIYKLIPHKKKLKFLVLLILIFFSIFAELLGITLIIPTIASFVNQSSESFYLLNQKLFFFSVLSQLNFKNLMLIFLSVFFFKTLFITVVYYFSQSFIADVQKEITNLIFIKNLQKDYANFISQNSSDKTRNIIELTNSFIYQCLMPLVVLITEIGFVLLVCIFLFFIDPISLISVTFFILILLTLYFKIINKKLYSWGKVKQNFLSQRLKILREAIDGIILIKINNLSNFFLKHFKYSSNISIDLTKRLLFLNNVIKVFLELFTIIILVGLIFMLIDRGFSKIEILSILSLYAVCAFKLLPSANRIAVNLQSLKFGSPVLPIIEKELFENIKKKQILDIEIKFEEYLKFKNVNFSYVKDLNIFENLNIDINKNDFVGIVGESGSGKSTFINLLCGLLIPDKGQIFIDDFDLSKANLNLGNIIGYVPQKIFLLDDNIEANIALGVENYSTDRIKTLIKESNFAKFIDDLPNGINTVIGEDGNKLSVGQKQRLNILRALYNDPDVLIFDESTSALDKENENSFLNLINEFKGKKTIIFITHKKELLNSFDKIYEIKNKQFFKIK